MGDWCSCDLYVFGNKKNIKEFALKAISKEEVISANNFIPFMDDDDKRIRRMMADWKDMKINYVVTDDGPVFLETYEAWVKEWQSNQWGTVYDLFDTKVYYCPNGSLKYSFTTKWGPPEKLIRKLSEMYPNLIFKLENYLVPDFWWFCYLRGEEVSFDSIVVLEQLMEGLQHAIYKDYQKRKGNGIKSRNQSLSLIRTPGGK